MNDKIKQTITDVIRHSSRKRKMDRHRGKGATIRDRGAQGESNG